MGSVAVGLRAVLARGRAVGISVAMSAPPSPIGAVPAGWARGTLASLLARRARGFAGVGFVGMLSAATTSTTEASVLRARRRVVRACVISSSLTSRASVITGTDSFHTGPPSPGLACRIAMIGHRALRPYRCEGTGSRIPMPEAGGREAAVARMHPAYWTAQRVAPHAYLSLQTETSSIGQQWVASQRRQGQRRWTSSVGGCSPTRENAAPSFGRIGYRAVASQRGGTRAEGSAPPYRPASTGGGRQTLGTRTGTASHTYRLVRCARASFDHRNQCSALSR